MISLERATAAIAAALVLGGLTAPLDAQMSIVNNHPAIVGFVDLSTSGGTQIIAPTGDSEHNIVTTVGNALFPAGNVRIGNNGVVVSGITTGDIGPLNVAIPASGVPAGIPGGNGAICAWWDDLLTAPAFGGFTPTLIMWKEEGGILYIMWSEEWHQAGTVSVGYITFEVQVFSSPAPGGPKIQIIYPDATFGTGAGAPFNNALSATVGYVAGANPSASNVQWSFDSALIPDFTVVSIFGADFFIAPSSPLGPGSIKLDFVSGPPNALYVLAATTFGGAYPDGWLFGLDISYAELLSEVSFGFPFVGQLGNQGSFALGPYSGLPHGLTVYAVAMAFAPGAALPSAISPAVSHLVP